MIARIFLLLFCFCCTSPVSAQLKGSEIVGKMHKKYYHAPCRAYTFSQKNTHYRNDSIIRYSEWYEAVEYPHKFRIINGEKKDSNFVIFRNDSVFRYKKGKAVKIAADTNNLLLLIGGMYYRELPDVLGRLKASGYDLTLSSEQDWNGKKVWVIGSDGNMQRNQFWIDKEDFKMLRIIEKMNDTDLMDMRFEAHQPNCKGWTETKVSFRRNGKLEQVEEYYDIKQIDFFPE